MFDAVVQFLSTREVFNGRNTSKNVIPAVFNSRMAGKAGMTIESGDSASLRLLALLFLLFRTLFFQRLFRFLLVLLLLIHAFGHDGLRDGGVDAKRTADAGNR
jgi:hypothetical protein